MSWKIWLTLYLVGLVALVAVVVIFKDAIPAVTIPLAMAGYTFAGGIPLLRCICKKTRQQHW